MNHLDVITSIIIVAQIDILRATLPNMPSKFERSIETFCEKLIRMHLKSYTHDADEFAYRNLFEKTLAKFDKKAEPVSEDGCDLTTVFRKVRFVFEFKVNQTIDERATYAPKYLSNFRDGHEQYMLWMGISYRNVEAAGEFTRDRLVCNWLAKLYRSNGTLKFSLPRKEISFLKPVPIKQEKFEDHYDMLEVIGSGGSGVVHRCRERRTGNIFAAKVEEVSRKRNPRKHIYREVHIMNQLHHPNLLELLDIYEYEEKLVLIFEYVSGGRLGQKRKSPETEVIEYVKQLCHAVLYMHERNIFHRDISPENILCRTNTCAETKLIDFSMAVQADPDTMEISHSSSSEEGSRTGRIGSYADMWSIGDVTYFLLSGTYPFTDGVGLWCEEYHDLNFDHPSFRNVSTECINFMERLLIKDNEKRMTIHEALNHPWLTGKP